VVAVAQEDRRPSTIFLRIQAYAAAGAGRSASLRDLPADRRVRFAFVVARTAVLSGVDRFDG
jgi:hypothetical protein